MFKSTKSATANAMVNAKASCAASMAASVLVINALSIQLGVFLISLISIICICIITENKNALYRTGRRNGRCMLRRLFSPR